MGVVFGESVDVDFTVTLEGTYTQNNIEKIDKYEISAKGKATLAEITILQSGVVCNLYSDSVSKSEKIEWIIKRTDGEIGKENITTETYNYDWTNLSYETINERFKDSGAGYQKFSEVLPNLENEYNNIFSDSLCQINSFSKLGGFFYVLEKINYKYYKNISVRVSIENRTDLPIFHGYKNGEWFDVPDLDYKCVSTITEKTYTEDNYISMPVDTYYSYPNFRHYALAHALYSEEYREPAKPKPYFAENIVTNICYDGTKKASLIIKHRFNLSEFQHFEEPTDVYKIPGFFINLAVNIRTISPISGESANVYNLYKIDLAREGIISNPLINDYGETAEITYTYGDLVKSCNNSTLGLPMKISVNVIQFGESIDGEPYVIYESPISSEIEINPVQHLYPEGSPAYDNTNEIIWNNFNNSDDGENSKKDGKNEDKGDSSGGTGSGQNAHNVLTTTYVSNALRLQNLGDFLWSSGFLDNILLVNNNPIENIVSVKMFPFTLPIGTESTIVLGNVDTEIPTNKLPDDYNYYHFYGGIKVPSYYNSFMDYAPFTKILLYLPFYGTIEVDNSLIIDRELKIAYIVDVVTGACTIDLYADESLINMISCQVGIDIPISSSNRAQVESAILSNTLTSTISGFSVGGVVGGVGGGVGGALLSAGHCKYNTQTSGTPSSATELYNVSTPMLIIDRPKYREITGFGHNKGKMCMLTKKLSDVEGFSIFDKNIDLSGIGCTTIEMEMLRDLLTSGVYL